MRRQEFFILVAGAVAAAGITLAATAQDLVLRTGGVEFPDGTSQITAAAQARSYYLTNFYVTAPNAPTSCADGYHMASMYEIRDTSNLKYDTTLGFHWGTGSDQGQGPPQTAGPAWIRTGVTAITGNFVGRANCGAWTSSDGEHYGTTAELVADMSEPWSVTSSICFGTRRVWCVED